MTATSRVAAGYMLETPSIRWYSFMSHPLRRVGGMGSENPSGAVNQQERPGFEQWVVGFVDGEGCFSISVVQNHGCRLGWQVQHEFSVTQAAPITTRTRGAHRVLRMWATDREREDRQSSVSPDAVLGERSIRSSRTDHSVLRRTPTDDSQEGRFQAFGVVISMMRDNCHLTREGLETIARITETMNRKQRSRYLESSEAIRQPALLRQWS